MNGLTLAAIWGMAVVSADADNYAAAHKAAVESGKPMVVMVSTDWCAPCQMMKKTVIPQVKRRGLFKKVVFTCVNPDQDRELADQVTGGGPIPQLVMYRKNVQGLAAMAACGRTERGIGRGVPQRRDCLHARSQVQGR